MLTLMQTTTSNPLAALGIGGLLILGLVLFFLFRFVFFRGN